MSPTDKQLSLVELTGLVVGAIIGGGVFNLVQDMTSGPAGAGAILIGWGITALGMTALALTFQNLTRKRPDLDAGIYSYAEAGFGKYIGFNAAWGYWMSAWLGNVGYAVLLMSAAGYFFPIFGQGQNIASIVVASMILWGCHFLIVRGVQSASLVNVIITVTKLIPIFLFIIVMLVSFRLHTFTTDFWLTPSGQFEWSSVFHQVKATMLSTVWVFLGIEGAVIVSGRAKHRQDVGRATVLGILVVLLIYMLITLLALGVRRQADLAQLGRPAMAMLLQQVVGKWGAIIVNLGLICSVVGAWLSWTLFAGQLPYEAAKKSTFPRWFAYENQVQAPTHSLMLTNGCVQIMMLTFLFTPTAYQFFYSIASSAVLIPYGLSALYQIKYSWQSPGPVGQRSWQVLIGLIGSGYAGWLLFAAGMSYWLLMTLLFTLGIPVYWWLQHHENHAQVIFSQRERWLVWGLVLGALVALGALLMRKINF